MRPSLRQSVATVSCGVLLALLCKACSDDRADIRRYRDIGALCLRPDEQGGTTIDIAFDVCLSCNQVPTASCSATVTDGRIAISTALDVENREEPDECPAGCSFARATCALEGPAAGDYLVVLYGARAATVTLPVAVALSPYDDRDCL